MADSLSGLVAPRLRQPGPRSPTRIWLAAVLLLLAAAPAVVSAQRPNNWPNPWPNHFPEPPANPPAQPVRVDPSNAVIDQYMRRGNDYLVGHGVPQDPVQAAYWYKKAADMGNPDAQTEIGYFYLHGIGVPRDDALAATWFMRGVGGGVSDGQAESGGSLPERYRRNP